MEKERETIESTIEYLKWIADQFGLEIIGDQIDLRDNSNEEVMKFFNTLAGSKRFLFHGTNSEDKFDTLEARQANDAAKESGNKKAVYANEGTTAPLAAALWNKRYLRSKSKSFITGWSSNNEGKMIFKFSPNIYELLKSGDTNMFSDGYVYVLNKDNFMNAEDAGAEWHAESDQKPVIAVRISKKLAESIFIIGDTVAEYSPEEMKKIDEFNNPSKTRTETEK